MLCSQPGEINKSYVINSCAEARTDLPQRQNFVNTADTIFALNFYFVPHLFPATLELGSFMCYIVP